MSEPQAQSKPSLVSRVIARSRLVVWLAVICTFVGSVLLMLIGAFDMVAGMWRAVAGLPAGHSDELKLALIESVDTFLVATVLFVISLGLYQLFIDRELQLPAWLNTSGVEDLEKRLAGMIIIVMAVIFLTQVIQWEGDISLLWLGLAIGVVMLAISAFLYQESKHHST